MVDKDVLQQLASKSPEELMAIIEATRKQLRTITKKEDSEASEEIKAQLKPFEDSLDKAEKGYASVKAAWTAKLEELKKNKKKAMEEADKRRKAARNELNKKRQELGLKATRRASVGPTMSWDVDINTSISPVVAIIAVSGQPDTETNIQVSEEGKVKAEVLRKEFFEKFEIVDETGGRLRGLMTRIKLAYLNAIDKNEAKEQLNK